MTHGILPLFFPVSCLCSSLLSFLFCFLLKGALNSACRLYLAVLSPSNCAGPSAQACDSLSLQAHSSAAEVSLMWLQSQQQALHSVQAQNITKDWKRCRRVGCTSFLGSCA